MTGLISTEGRAQLRAIREAELRQRGVGGAAWVVTRRSGDGVGTPTTPATIGTAAVLVGERPAGQIAGAAPGSLVAATAWEAIVIGAGPVLQAEDVLTSVATPSLAVRLRSRVDRRLHETWEVTPQ